MGKSYGKFVYHYYRDYCCDWFGLEIMEPLIRGPPASSIRAYKLYDKLQIVCCGRSEMRPPSFVSNILSVRSHRIRTNDRDGPLATSDVIGQRCSTRSISENFGTTLNYRSPTLKAFIFIWLTRFGSRWNSRGTQGEICALSQIVLCDKGLTWVAPAPRDLRPTSPPWGDYVG